MYNSNRMNVQIFHHTKNDVTILMGSSKWAIWSLEKEKVCHIGLEPEWFNISESTTPAWTAG